MSRLTKIMKSSSRGDAAYPEWIQINKIEEFIYKGQLEYCILFFPIWDIRKISHFIGAMDSFLYMTLFYLVFKNRKIIWKDLV